MTSFECTDLFSGATWAQAHLNGNILRINIQTDRRLVPIHMKINVLPEFCARVEAEARANLATRVQEPQSDESLSAR